MATGRTHGKSYRTISGYTGNLGVGYNNIPSYLIEAVQQGIGATQVDAMGMILRNATSAVTGTVQMSPALLLEGQAFGSTLGISQKTTWRMDVLPVTAATPTSTFQLSQSINGGAYTVPMSLTSAGNATFLGGVTAVNGTFSSTISCTGITATTATLNFFISSNASTGNASASYTLGGVNSSVRVGLANGSSDTAMLANFSHASVYVAPSTARGIAASGTHNVITALAIRSISISNPTAGGLIGIFADQYIEGASSAITVAPSSGNTTYGIYTTYWKQGATTTLTSGTTNPTAFRIDGAAHTGLILSVESIDINMNLARTVQFATGALTTQRAFLIQAPTYGFVGASTITNAATFAISGAPVAGTNATLTNSYALWVQAGIAQFDGTIQQAGKTAKYNGVATTGWGQPAIYGTGRSTGQTAANASVATYTCGAADGSFIVYANINLTASTTNSITCTCTYNDENNTSRTLTFSFVQNGVPAPIQTITNVTGVGAYCSMPLQIRVKASTAITIATTGTFTSVTYNVEGNIEQIA
jgi:hypothetical protein